MASFNADAGNLQKLIGLYENPILEYWHNVYTDQNKDSVVDELFSFERSSNPTEAVTSLVGAADFDKWNGQFTFSGGEEGNTKVFSFLKWQAGRSFDSFTLANSKILDLKNAVGKFAIEAARLRQTLMAGIFNNAASTTFSCYGNTINNTVANGLALASNSHTSANYATTQDNYGTDTLTEANLESAIQAVAEYKDEDGNDCNLFPDTLVVPTRLRQTAIELIGGEGKVNVANNNPNIYYGSMKLVVWKQFRKAAGATGHPWMVVDSQAAKMSLKVINRLPSGDDYDTLSWFDKETLTWKIGSVMWLGAGAIDWRPFFINIPA